MELWFPEAKRSLIFSGAGSYVFGPYRGVLHTTEGPTIAGALGAYRSTGSYPHFTVDADTVEQHIPINVAATALEHRSGTVDTNRASATQIEIVGRAADSAKFPPLLLDRLARLMRWIEAQTGIEFYDHANFIVNWPRFTEAEWRAFNSWCGHAHVPNNSHWDPGALPINRLGPVGVSALIKPKQEDEEEMPKPEDIVSEYRWPTGRSVVRLLRNGDIRCYGLTYRGNIRQIPDKARLSWTEGEGVVFPIDITDPEKGYEVRDIDDNMLAEFTPEWAAANLK